MYSKLRSMIAGFLLLILVGTVWFSAWPSVAQAEAPAESGYVGAALALGPAFWVQPRARYEATSIGTIEFPCQTKSVPFSLMFLFKKGPSHDPKRLWQLELGGSWVKEEGSKRWSLQGYPATANSRMSGLLFGAGFVFHYLKVWKIWFGSGYRFGWGWVDERFSVHLQRDGQDVTVFDPSSKTRVGTLSDYGVLSVKMLEGFWGAWELQLGYSDIDAERYGGYGDHGNGGVTTKTHTSGWYLRVRKVFPLNLNWKRIAGAKRETG